MQDNLQNPNCNIPFENKFKMYTSSAHKRLTTQSISASACGTSRPISTLGGQESDKIRSITFTMPCVRTSTDHDAFETVS